MKFELEEYHRNALEKFVEYINQEKIPIIENGGESVLWKSTNALFRLQYWQKQYLRK